MLMGIDVAAAAAAAAVYLIECWETDYKGLEDYKM